MADTATLPEAEAALEQDARRRAAADPLPGALADAFLEDAIQIGDNLYVRRVVASDWKVLKWLDSPIFKAMLEMQKDEGNRDEIAFTDEEQYEMAWQFTHTPAEVRELMTKGREGFKKSCEQWADHLDFASLPSAINALQKQILKSFSTSLKYGGEDEAKKKLPM